MRRLMTARAAAARQDAVRDALAAMATPGLLIAPTRGAARDTLRTDPSMRNWLGTRPHSLLGWARESAAPRLAALGRVPLEPLSAEALAARILAERGPELEHLAPALGAAGLPRALARTLEDLRRFQIQPSALKILGTAAGRDLAQLLERHVELLEAEAVADVSAVLAAAAPTETGLGVPIALLDVAPSDPATEAFVAALAHHAEACFACVSPEHPELARLERALGLEAQPLEEEAPEDNLRRARQFLFRAEEPPPSEPDEGLVVFSAPGEGRECVEIVRSMLARAEEGLPFDRMAILLRDPERYQRPLAEALARADVPAHHARPLSVPDPAGRALLALLDCAAEGLSAERFAEYLSFGELPPPDPDTGAPPMREVPWVKARDERQLSFFSLEPDPDGEPAPSPPRPDPEAPPVLDGQIRAPARWERMLVDAAVVGGAERWARRLAGLREEREAQLRQTERDEPERAGALAQDIQRLKDLEAFALPLVGQLAALKSSRSWGAWLDALEQLAVRALRAPEKPLRVLAELRPMADIGPVGLDEVQLVLAERLATLREPADDDDPYGKVFIGDFEDAAGRSFDVVYVPGLAEGIFPRRASEDPLLLDAARAALHPDLPRRPRAIREERARLRSALERAEIRLEASYPEIDPERGRPRVPSFYALDLLRSAEGSLPATRALEVRAAAASGSRPGLAAPRDPLRAIDGAELDLALLAEGQRSDALAGGGRYLLDGETPHSHLARALRARARRHAPRYTAWDGLQLEASNASLMAPHRLNTRPTSASALERYSACPLQYYLHAILRLQPREPLARPERMDPRTRGSIAHDALFYWMRGLQEDDRVPWEPDELPEVLERLSNSVRAVGAQYAEQIAPAIATVWDRELGELERDLRAFVLREEAEPQRFEPLHAELAFGLSRGERDPSSQAAPVELEGGFLIRGSVDLVEREPTLGWLRITDYKTGKSKRLGEPRLAGGQHLQPALYAAAVGRMLGDEVSAARLAFCTARGQHHSEHFQVGPQTQAQLQHVLRDVDAEIGAGRMLAAPRDAKTCTYCDFAMACSPSDAERLSGKDRSPLVVLDMLRDTK